MINTNTNKFKARMKEYLEPIIRQKAEDYDQTIEGNPYSWVVGIARSEVYHEFHRHGNQAGLEYWLSGLGMGIDCYNSDIIKVAEKLHDCKLTEKETETVVAGWFRFVAVKILQFSRAAEEVTA